MYARGDAYKTAHTICTEAAEDINATVNIMQDRLGLIRFPHMVVYV